MNEVVNPAPAVAVAAPVAQPATMVPAPAPAAAPVPQPAQPAQPTAPVDAAPDGEEAMISLSDLAGISMDAVEAKERFHIFPVCTAQFACVGAGLELTSKNKPFINFKCKAVRFFGSSDPNVPADGSTVVGEDYDHNFFVKGADDVGYAKKFMQDVGFEGTGTLQEVLANFAASGLQWTAVIKHTDNNNGGKFVNMNEVKPATEPMPVA
jgi:hypothetical protein